LIEVKLYDFEVVFGSRYQHFDQEQKSKIHYTQPITPRPHPPGVFEDGWVFLKMQSYYTGLDSKNSQGFGMWDLL